MLAEFLTLLILFDLSNAQSFSWSFNTSATTFSSCQALGVIIKNSANASPPFYMLAYEVDGTPTRTALGSQNLTWRVDHAGGKTLMLSVVDSQGNLGEIPPSLFTVTNGDTSCLPKPLNSDLILIANVSNTLETCQSWGLSIAGGTPPYTLTLAALDSRTVTNATLGLKENLFTYVNRASPNGALLAAASDAAGNWAAGTSFVKTTGSADLTCNHRQSTSGVTTIARSEASTSQQSSSSTSADSAGATTPSSPQSSTGDGDNSRTIIIGACTAVGIFLLVTALLCFCIHRKRKKNIRSEISPFTSTQGHLMRTNTTTTSLLQRSDTLHNHHDSYPTTTSVEQLPSTLSHDSSWWRPSVTTNRAPPPPPPSIGSWVAGESVAASSQRGTSIISPISHGTSLYTDRKSGFTTTPTSENHNYTDNTHHINRSASGSGPGSSGAVGRSRSRRREKGSGSSPPENFEMSRRADDDITEGPTMVIIHRDGGAPGRVEELPPPYPHRFS